MVFAKKAPAASRTRSIAQVALCIAIMIVCAWVTVPFGPVPFTLQTFAVAIAVMALRPKEALAAVAGYLALGAVGLPVFSGMRGGIGMLAGPTGGFLWGFLVGGAVAAGVLWALRGRAARSRRAELAARVVAAVAFLAVTYLIGWAQLMAVSGMGPAEAFVAAIAPFILPDVAKMAMAVAVAGAVQRVLGR